MTYCETLFWYGYKYMHNYYEFWSVLSLLFLGAILTLNTSGLNRRQDIDMGSQGHNNLA